MKSNLFIPKKIHVGYQERNDTYTGKLAYVVYEDEKGVIRKKTSWDSWINKSLEQHVFDNVPTRYIFNKGVQRQGYFGSGRSVIRVYDTRDFEFEISVDNLIGILMYSDISKRDIQEECVFAWYGKDLILLSVNSEEYQQSIAYTNKQSLKLSAKELVKGYTYSQKKSDNKLVYMGYYDWYQSTYSYSQEYYGQEYYGQEYKGKKHIFYDLKCKNFCTPAIATLASVIDESVYSSFAEIDK